MRPRNSTYGIFYIPNINESKALCCVRVLQGAFSFELGFSKFSEIMGLLLKGSVRAVF